MLALIWSRIKVVGLLDDKVEGLSTLLRKGVLQQSQGHSTTTHDNECTECV